ncbi:hypothetical protein EJ06DRAFT_285709 [Trichodelitschia bisporula]|uniref:HTH CENPB-type domain-containing protein n=1 Tax=Trichodelitschia bisporula TaxID=703511 RepID=A0A6G1I6E8_9PEZI|nr:hypothetical protein EJ06DRAFT_285709 [Trichodelitschia bisporula]
MSDALIREKLRFFATTVGSPDSHQKANNASWLEKFKQKNNLLGAGAKSRKNSVAAADENGAGSSAPDSSLQQPASTPVSNPASGAHSPSTNLSPSSPHPHLSQRSSSVSGPASLTPHQTQHQTPTSPPTKHAPFPDFPHHKPYHSLSASSLASAFADSEPASGYTPTSPEAFFSPGLHAPYSPASAAQQQQAQSQAQPQRGSATGPLGSSAFHPRPRSQTFPVIGSLDAGFTGSGGGGSGESGPGGGHGGGEGGMGGSGRGSPLGKYEGEMTGLGVVGLDMGMATSSGGGGGRESMLTRRDAGSVETPATPDVKGSPRGSPTGAAGGTPSVEDTRRALEVVMSFFQLEPQEYLVVGKLMQKLELHSRGGGEMPGGMHRIEQGGFGARGDGQ